MSNANQKLDVRCPHCFEDASISVNIEGVCPKCKKSLLGVKYLKPLIGGGTTFLAALIIGLVTGSLGDDYFERERYPVAVEYSIVERGLTTQNAPIERSVYVAKKEILIKALEETQKEVSYEEYEEDPKRFMGVFTVNVLKLAGG